MLCPFHLRERNIWEKISKARKSVKDLRKKLAEYLKQQPCEDAVSRDCDKCAYYDDGLAIINEDDEENNSTEFTLIEGGKESE